MFPKMDDRAVKAAMKKMGIQQQEMEAEISGDDVKTVMEKAGVSEEEARKALIKANGDLAEAILELNKV